MNFFDAINFYMICHVYDKAFVRLSREYLEHPNYGLPPINRNDEKYLSNKPVSADEIPMIFEEKYSIKF